MNELTRSALSGSATGGRTFTGLAALAATTPPSAETQPDRTLARPAALGAIGLLAVAELVADKLPQAPSRLGPPGLIGRLVVSAGCGVIVARRAWSRDDLPAPPAEPAAPGEPAPDPRLIATCALTATAAAVGTAWLGMRWRALASRRLGPAWVGAVIEDAVVLALAAAARG